MADPYVNAITNIIPCTILTFCSVLTKSQYQYFTASILNCGITLWSAKIHNLSPLLPPAVQEPIIYNSLKGTYAIWFSVFLLQFIVTLHYLLKIVIPFGANDAFSAMPHLQISLSTPRGFFPHPKITNKILKRLVFKHQAPWRTLLVTPLHKNSMLLFFLTHHPFLLLIQIFYRLNNHFPSGSLSNPLLKSRKLDLLPLYCLNYHLPSRAASLSFHLGNVILSALIRKAGLYIYVIPFHNEKQRTSRSVGDNYVPAHQEAHQ